MSMRATLYEGFSLTMLFGSLFFLYRAVEFLAQKDYVAGVVTVGIGFIVIRVGVELGRLAFVARREDGSEES